MKSLKKLICSFIFTITLALPINAYAYSYNVVFDNVPPSILNWGCPSPTWAGINSKWEQPRPVGTNPHQGVDVQSSYGTEVYAVWNGWLSLLWEDSTGYNVQLKIDANNNGVQDDPTYYCRYYHLQNYGYPGYYSKGSLIGHSGYSSAPHLHFGGTYSSAKWYRNETQYRWTSYWNSGREVDSFSRVLWNTPSTNRASITAYFKDENGYYQPSEVRLYHRRNGTSAWTDGGTMTYSGSYVYTYNFSGLYSSGTTINWLVRIKRSGLGSVYPYAWAPAKYDQPDPNPNATSYTYAYYTNTIQ
jgi:murein DD-endopeptidase MepM/ murein hydrolase activator NlpD